MALKLFAVLEGRRDKDKAVPGLGFVSPCAQRREVLCSLSRGTGQGRNAADSGVSNDTRLPMPHPQALRACCCWSAVGPHFLPVQQVTTGRGEVGVIEGSFGKSGKLKVR